MNSVSHHRIGRFETLETRDLLAVNVFEDIQGRLPYSSYPRDFSTIGDRTYFETNIGVWHSDGSPEGTLPLKRLTDAQIAFAHNDLLIVRKDDEFWRTDGTDQGTFSLGIKDSERLWQDDHRFFFERFVKDAEDRWQTQLWFADLATGETEIVLHQVPNNSANLGSPVRISQVAANDQLTILAVPMDDTRLSVYRIDDATTATRITEMTSDAMSHYVLPDDSGMLYFVGSESADFETNLYRTDGRVVESLGQFASASDPFDGPQLFQLGETDLLIRFLGHNREVQVWHYGIDDGIWRSIDVKDGQCPSHCNIHTLGDTALVHSRNGIWSYPAETTDGRWLFRESRSTTGHVQLLAFTDGGMLAVRGAKNRIWVTDGTPEGTRQLSRIFRYREFGFLGDQMLFAHADAERGEELWQSRDRTADSIELLKDIRPTFFPSGGTMLQSVAFADKLLFELDERRGEYWILADDVATLVRLNDFHPELESAQFVEIFDYGTFRRHNGRVYFITREGNLHTLWTTDGTPAGTYSLLNTTDRIAMVLRPGTNDWLEFQTSDGQTWSLWRTSGTPESTIQLTDDATDVVMAFGNTNKSILDLDGAMAFVASRADAGTEVWTTDFTVEGTRPISNLSSDTTSVLLEHVADNRLLFIREGEGDDVYLTDGSLESTTPLGDLLPKPRGRLTSSVDEMVSINEKTFFTLGSTLWVTEGDSRSTRMVPGAESLYPQHLHALGDQLLFLSNSGDLWGTNGAVTEQLWEHPRPRRQSRVDAFRLGEQLVLQLHSSRILIQTDGTKEGTQVLVERMGNALQQQGNEIIMVSNRSVVVYGETGPVQQIPFLGRRQRVTSIAPIEEGLVVFARDGWDTKVYFSDGTPHGTYLLEDIENFVPHSTRIFRTTENAIFVEGQFTGEGPTVVRVSLQPTSDVNLDGRVNAGDVDTLMAAHRANDTMERFDLNKDLTVDEDDVATLVEDFFQTKPGDVDLNGQVNFADFLRFSANFGRRSGSGWEDGDFNSDGKVDMEDFFPLSANFGFDRFI